jgi:hypothetical protein
VRLAIAALVLLPLLGPAAWLAGRRRLPWLALFALIELMIRAET